MPNGAKMTNPQPPAFGLPVDPLHPLQITPVCTSAPAGDPFVLAPTAELGLGDALGPSGGVVASGATVAAGAGAGPDET